MFPKSCETQIVKGSSFNKGCKSLVKAVKIRMFQTKAPTNKAVLMCIFLGQEISDTPIQRPADAAPCACERDDRLWKQTAPRAPRCRLVPRAGCWEAGFQKMFLNM